MKPHKGTILNYRKIKVSEPTDEHLGFVVWGLPHGHPEFVNWIRTSLVVKEYPEINEIETLNSRYSLEFPDTSV